MEETKTYNVALAIKAQEKFQKEKNYPYFAPSNGICWKCKKQIYSEGGYSVERAGSTLITGCPFCHWSYCE